ncbi:hypothetical protein TNCT_86701 [Trichonephila clavata]|uniref:Uncharacterized protein n=1 Tax=Trichonephila clavata TaxID=2740835 RepID=A0A8X6J728_TRICU|nr:hypothetical protein TNCT_86701 [Trichonephila clavata]
MKQDLKKTETVCFSNFLSKKKLSKVPRNVNAVPGGTTATPADPSGKTEYQKKDEENKLVETINVRFDEYRKGVDFKPKTSGYPRLDLNFPDYDDEEDDFDTVRDSLASRLVSKTSTETPTTSFEKPDLSSDNRSLIPCSEVKWIRNIGLLSLVDLKPQILEINITQNIKDMEPFIDRCIIEYQIQALTELKQNSLSLEL